jgi:hypothetical protein
MNAGTKIAQEIFRLRNADAERAAAQKQEERIFGYLECLQSEWMLVPNGKQALAVFILQLTRHCLGDCESRELPRRRLGNLWSSPWIGKIEPSHIFKIGLRETASELAGQPGSQFTDDLNRVRKVSSIQHSGTDSGATRRDCLLL